MILMCEITSGITAVEESDGWHSSMVRRLIVFASNERHSLGHHCLQTFETAKDSKERWCRPELNPVIRVSYKGKKGVVAGGCRSSVAERWQLKLVISRISYAHSNELHL